MEYRCGIWKKVAKSGTKYCTGKIKLGTTEYNVVLFNNEKKNEKSPDFNLILKDALIVPEKEKQVEITPENIPRDDLADSVFEAFGNQIEFDDDMPF